MYVTSKRKDTDVIASLTKPADRKCVTGLGLPDEATGEDNICTSTRERKGHSTHIIIIPATKPTLYYLHVNINDIASDINLKGSWSGVCPSDDDVIVHLCDSKICGGRRWGAKYIQNAKVLTAVIPSCAGVKPDKGSIKGRDEEGYTPIVKIFSKHKAFIPDGVGVQCTHIAIVGYRWHQVILGREGEEPLFPHNDINCWHLCTCTSLHLMVVVWLFI